jgi:hypothetical protein
MDNNLKRINVQVLEESLVQDCKSSFACHSEEAGLELYCMAVNNRPTKNLTFRQARSVF